MDANLALSYGLAASVFVPLFVVAVIMLRSFGRALVLTLTFAAGAAAGFLAAVASGRGLMRSTMGAPPPDVLLVVFLSAAAIAGGLIAVFILGRFSKNSPWRRT
ncbi:MAG: hypothetical protein WDO72_11385 [Pseudomonadota bacterium]